jgi:hypothetical protein
MRVFLTDHRAERKAAILVCAGELVPDEAVIVASILGLKRETIEIERRPTAIETGQARQK